MKLKHLDNIREWNIVMKEKFPQYMYTHHRDDTLGSKKYISNCCMPIDIFDNKKKYTKLLCGSEYYPPGIDSLDAEEFVIVKKPKGSGGEGHVITKVKNVERVQRVNHDIQYLVRPLLINDKKFHMRTLMGFDSTNIYLPWEDSLVLLNPNEYRRGVMETEITNTAFNGSENIKNFDTVEKILKENNLYDEFIVHMQCLKNDLKERYCSICKTNSFDIHGIDIIIDEAGKPMIMETNPYWYSGKDEGWIDKIKMFEKIMYEISNE